MFLGYLHKSGIKQLESYIEFAKQLEQEVDITELSKDIPECVLLVYDKLSTTAHQRFISTEEFLDVAKDYFERVKRVWNWQNENGTDARQAFRDCPVVKAHPSYRLVKDNISHQWKEIKARKLGSRGGGNGKWEMGSLSWLKLGEIANFGIIMYYLAIRL